jgi:Icc protein
MLVLAHLSDTHIGHGDASVDRARQAMTYVNGFSALDAVVVTGDIAAQGRPDEYEVARSVFSSRHLVVHCPGNHDDRDAYRRVLLGSDDTGDAGPVNQFHETAGALLVLLDSTVPGELGGELGRDTLGWLRGVLARIAPSKPVVIGLHHPPVPLGSPVMDPIGLADADALAEVVDDHPRVAAVLCGHAHSAAAATFAGRPLRVAPGVVSTLALPWQDAPAFDRSAPVQVAFHILVGDQLVTHYRVVPESVKEDTPIDA